MSIENQDRVRKILSDIGVGQEIIDKKERKPTVKKMVKQSYAGINAIGNVEGTTDKPSGTVRFIKNKALSENIRLKSWWILALFIASVYISIGDSYGLYLPEALVYYNHPYLFMLVNATLLIGALYLSIDVLYDGLKQLPKANLNTLAVYISSTSLVYLCGVIILKDPVGYLPFSSLAILILHFAVKDYAGNKRNLSYLYKLDSLQIENRYIVNSRRGRQGYIFHQSDSEDFTAKEDAFHGIQTIYFYTSVVFTILVSIVLGGHNITYVLWILSGLSCMVLPISFIMNFPKEKVSKILFRQGVSIKDFYKLDTLLGNRTIAVNDHDLFGQNTIFLDALRLLGTYSAEQVISICQAGFSAMNLAATQAFEREMQSRYIAPTKIDQILDENKNGFSFLYHDKKISIGNTAYVVGLGLNTIEARNVDHPMFVVIDSKIIAIMKLRYSATSEIYDLLGLIDKRGIKLMLTSLDFNIKVDMITEIFDISTVVLPEYHKRYEVQNYKDGRAKNILLKRQQGSAYLTAVLFARRIRYIIHQNIFIGFFGMTTGVAMVSYLADAPQMLLPQNMIAFALLWFVPTVITSILSCKI